MLTKKQIKMIAKIIKAQAVNDGPEGDNLEPGWNDDFEQGWDEATEQIACLLALFFAGQNPCFDREKFMKACGLPSGL